eukprot:3582467-Alexandrium_andersonii.AAC.1
MPAGAAAAVARSERNDLLRSAQHSDSPRASVACPRQGRPSRPAGHSAVESTRTPHHCARGGGGCAAPFMAGVEATCLLYTSDAADDM